MPRAKSTESKTPKVKKEKTEKTSKKIKSNVESNPDLAIVGKKNLVIVESPAKSQTIKKYLGDSFEVKASFGHVVDLPGKELGIDIANNFQPKYQVSDDKKKVISELKNIAKKCDKVRIATDEDREGEAIGRHVATELGLDLDKTPRIVFHEITKNAILNAVENPRTVDMSLVDAQQGRRILDRLVGFKVSPVLRQKVKRGTSAGRVQSVAVKLVVEREREIQNFQPDESWKCKADLKHKNGNLGIELSKINGKKHDLKAKDQTVSYLESIGCNAGSGKETTNQKDNTIVINYSEKINFELKNIEAKDFKKSPPPPFTTSSLQQTASRMFGRGVKKVMMVAQKLYEHGHITYMRTDSLNLSQLAINGASEYISSTYGKNYVQTRNFKSKSKNAQEAHEAIRPTHIEHNPGVMKLESDEKKLYTLIWDRMLGSQMADATGKRTIYYFCPVSKPKDERIVKGEVITFDGWLKISEKIQKENDDDNNKEGEITNLPKIEIGEVLESLMIIASQHFTKPPARFTEASLVKMLEEKGIGRPSTYAPTIATIQTRGYIERRENKLFPTDIAFTVTDFLDKHFSDLMNYEFTAKMEEKLDEIAEGKIGRQKMMKDFRDGFEKNLKDAGGAEKEIVFTGEKCPDCGNNLIFRFGRNGKFIACEKYPECKYTRNIVKDASEMTDEEIKRNSFLEKLKEKFEGKPCEAGGTLVVKMGRFGPFLASSDYPTVKRIGKIPDDKVDYLNKKYGGKTCEKCGDGKMTIKKKKGKSYEPYFLGCNQYPKCSNIENFKLTPEDKEALKNM